MDRVLPFRFAEEEGVFWLLDQRRLPQEEVYVPVRTAREMAQAIRDMVVRGRRPSGSPPPSAWSWPTWRGRTSRRRTGGSGRAAPRR